MTTARHHAVPGHEGSVGPFRSEYRLPHVYARDVQSGVGNCVCAAALGDVIHTEAAPGVPIPSTLRPRRRCVGDQHVTPHLGCGMR